MPPRQPTPAEVRARQQRTVAAFRAQREQQRQQAARPMSDSEMSINAQRLRNQLIESLTRDRDARIDALLQEAGAARDSIERSREEVDFSELGITGVRRPTGWWQMRTGMWIQITQMTTGHLRNTIQFLQRRGNDSHGALGEMIAEERRRHAEVQGRSLSPEEVARLQMMMNYRRPRFYSGDPPMPQVPEPVSPPVSGPARRIRLK